MYIERRTIAFSIFYVTSLTFCILLSCSQIRFARILSNSKSTENVNSRTIYFPHSNFYGSETIESQTIEIYALKIETIEVRATEIRATEMRFGQFRLS